MLALKARSKIVFAEDMIFFVDNAKGPTEKFLEVISEFSKITDYKESHFFPYVPSMKLKLQIRKSVPCTIAPEIEVLRYNSNKLCSGFAF